MVFETWLKSDLKKPMRVVPLTGNLFSADNNGNLVGVEVLDNGQPAQLTGAVTGYVIRADGATVTVTGELDGNKASITLPASAYIVVGQVSIVIKVGNVTVGACVSNVYRTSTDTLIDPGHILPSISELLARINAAVATIPASWDGLMADIAPTYSDTAVYPVGSYVYYSGDLYRCTTAITTAESWTAGHWTKAVLGNDVTDLKSAIKPIYIDYDTSNPQTGWARYDDGAIMPSTATYKYVIPNIGYKYVKAFLASESYAIAAIALYDSSNVGASSYIKSASVAFQSGYHYDGLWYSTEIPQNCETIVISTLKPSENVISPIILLDKIGVIEDETDGIKTNLQNVSEIADNTYMIDIDAGVPVGSWVRYSDGAVIVSSATDMYKVENKGFGTVKAFLASETNALAAIAFFDTLTPETNSYMSSASVQFQSGYHKSGLWYTANVPDGCKLIVFVTLKPSESVASPLFKSDSPSKINYNYATLGEYDAKIKALNNGILSGDWKYIYHYGMGAIGNRDIIPVIPSQSVFDVQNAYNLGYKCIEANMHITSDGKYVVTHGLNGALGHDFDTLNGEDAYGVVIANTTFNTLRSNYRYRSSVADYRTPITSLEEFLHEAKLYNMIVVMQYRDETSLTIARGIMGDKLIMYDAPRNSYDGVILEYRSYTTKTEILAHCNSIGKPYIYSMGNTTSFTDEELQDIINTLHENGYYLATAYVSGASLTKLSAMGFDYFAVDYGYVTSSVILDGKKLLFDQDGTVHWEDAEIR